MGISEGVINFSLSKVDMNDEYVDDFNPSTWEAPDEYAAGTVDQPSSRLQYQLPSRPNCNGYDSSDEVCSMQTARPEVTLRNVLSGLVTILTGGNKCSALQGGNNIMGNQKASISNISFFTPGKNGDTCLHHSVVYPPSAPLLVLSEALKFRDYREVLEAEPPEWLPDSFTTACMQCNALFTALSRGRHHCRFCGGIFCRACSKGRCLLPAKFRIRNPQRVCDTCYDRLDPLQDIMISSISNAAQTAKHDVTDWTCTRGWLNLPLGFSMEDEIYKATNALRSYSQAARIDPERSIPHAVLKGAKGLAFLTVAKAGAFVTYKIGTGLVVARRANGSWSAPSAILSFGLGWGPQIGGELTDFIIVLHDLKAVKTFCGRMHFSFGAGLSVAAGPVGRVLEADLRAGDRGSGICYTYSCSKGAFIGVSLEGNIVMTRMDANLRFYGNPYLTTDGILLGKMEVPTAAKPLYSALDDVYSNMEKELMYSSLVLGGSGSEK